MNGEEPPTARVALAFQNLRRARWRARQALVAAVDVGGVTVDDLAYALGAESPRDVEQLVRRAREELAREVGDQVNDERRERERRSGGDRRRASHAGVTT